PIESFTASDHAQSTHPSAPRPNHEGRTFTESQLTPFDDCLEDPPLETSENHTVITRLENSSKATSQSDTTV
ncbi:hypothetical protein Ancab_028817, partial [Ancistrocladus abbreviatus]